MALRAEALRDVPEVLLLLPLLAEADDPRGDAGGVGFCDDGDRPGVAVKPATPPAWIIGQNCFQCESSTPPICPHAWHE